MTNFEHIKSMSMEEFAAWLDEYGQFDDSPWSNWFNNKYCANCEPIKCKYKDTEEKLGFTPYLFGSYTGDLECAFCELEKKCKFFLDLDDIPANLEIIKMWLMKEAE